MTDIFSNKIKELLKLVTEDFDKFYKETDKKSKSSGYDSTAASSGYGSKAASSGDCSKAASSGDCSKAASSGDDSTAASSGYDSTAASSGYGSKAASSGDYSTAASSGYGSKAASSGDDSTAASSGDYSTAASSGDYSTAASSGDCGACAAIGKRAAVMGDKGNLIMCSEYDKNNKPVGGLASIVDGKIIKEKTWYIVEKNKWVEVDFTDGLFCYVLSSKSGVKKLKNEYGDVLYCVTTGEFSAHGKTIKDARESLIYKMQDRDLMAYKNMPKDTVKTAKEWAAVYHVVTGACVAGCESFIKSKGKLKKTYTLAEILEQTKGAYGHDKFKEVVNG